MSTSDIHVVLQEVGGRLVVPLQDPVYDQMIEVTRERLLNYLHERAVSAVVLDLSAVEVLDGYDFEKLRQLADAMALMGAPVILAGIRPGVAAGLVALDVDDRWVRTALNVSQALARSL